MAEEILEQFQVVSDTNKRQIVENVEELRRSNARLRAENEMFERFISRLDPRDLVHQTISDSLAVEGSLESLQCLTLEQKCEVAESEIGEMRKDVEKLKKSSEREINHYKAALEEADIRLVEVRTERCKFEQDVVKVLREKRGVMMGPEKVIRYIEDGIRSKDTLIEKLRLKNAALRAYEKKLRLQLHQKDEMGKAQHGDFQPVDFQELKTEKKKFVERIDEINQDYLHLNRLARDNQKVLNFYQQKELHSATCESKGLSSDIASRGKMLLKIEEETLQAEKELAKEQTLNKNLRGQLADAHAPDVMQYIAAKESHDQLEKSVRDWDRKVKIAEMDLKTQTKAWNQLKGVGRNGPVAPK
ncbi:hypothetical protein UPYG_G00264190 [Umbra pygmaea]|uniref:Cilia- and flagella-associated protein 263 n=1 Tax=Umbra pygmaea TaxID=75934 RepID=A0ABD0WEC9_UMBPY